MANIAFILEGDIEDELLSTTDNALEAARELPGEAILEAFEFVLDESPVWSGAFRSSIRVGIDDVPASGLATVSNAERQQRHRSGNLFPPASFAQAASAAESFELGDTLSLGSDVPYAELVDEQEDNLISERAAQRAEDVLNALIQKFNQRVRSRRGRGRRRRRR